MQMVQDMQITLENRTLELFLKKILIGGDDSTQHDQIELLPIK